MDPAADAVSDVPKATASGTVITAVGAVVSGTRATCVWTVTRLFAELGSAGLPATVKVALNGPTFRGVTVTVTIACAPGAIVPASQTTVPPGTTGRNGTTQKPAGDDAFTLDTWLPFTGMVIDTPVAVCGPLLATTTR